MIQVQGVREGAADDVADALTGAVRQNLQSVPEAIPEGDVQVMTARMLRTHCDPKERRGEIQSPSSGLMPKQQKAPAFAGASESPVLEVREEAESFGFSLSRWRELAEPRGWTQQQPGRGGSCERCARASLPYRCLLYTSPSPRDRTRSRMPSSA